MADMYRMFPRLEERQHTAADVLSGSEQQMLTLCRTLMGDPDLIMIDEPTEGLAPKMVGLVAQYLKKLKDKGISVLLVEQKLAIALEISQRVYVMGHGAIVFAGTPADLRANAAVRTEWLEVWQPSRCACDRPEAKPPLGFWYGQPSPMKICAGFFSRVFFSREMRDARVAAPSRTHEQA